MGSEDAMSQDGLPHDWHELLASELEAPYFKALHEFVTQERKEKTVYPPKSDVYTAFQLTPFDRVKVLLLGQDPYHDEGQAHGLAFSVKPGVKSPPSLRNILKELHNELGCKIPNNGCLEPWARQGVMLLNAVLTVRAHEPASHQGMGWERFTDTIIRKLSDRDDPLVFALWGGFARKKSKLIDDDRHIIIESAHPSPLSAAKFFGSKPFSKINSALKKLGKDEIDWQLPDV
jgi:uracil-DNA glycosylase